MSQEKIDILQRALKREKAARKAAEKILEDKSRDLYFLTKELKKANLQLENLLDEKSTQLQGVFENINDAYIIMDIFGKILKMNDIAIDFFGYNIEKEELNVTDLIYSEDAEYAYSSYNTLKNEGAFNNYIARILTKDKQVKWVQINATLIFDKDNNPIAAQGIIRDITSDKEAEDLLIESENRLSSLIVNLDSAILLEDENRKIVLVNPKFCELFSIPVSPDLLKGQDCNNAANDSKNLFKNPEEFISRITTILENKKQVLGDELIMKDGTILERDFIPILKGNQYKGHLWTYKNVTLSRQFRKTLETQKQKYSNIIANMNLGLIEVNNEDEILMINQSFSEMSGYSEEEIIGKTANQIFLTEKESNVILEQTKKRFKGKSNSFELEIKTKSGQQRIWLISGAPNYNLNGEVIGSIGIHLDITEAKLNSELIQQQKEELKVIVNNSSIGIALIQDNQILRTNAKFQKMLGFSESELSAISFDDLTFEEDLHVSEANINQITAGKIDDFVVEKRFKKKDGSIIWVKKNMNVVRDNNGKVKYQVAIIEDITSEREKTIIINLVNKLTKSILGMTDINDIAWEIINNIAEYLNSDDCVIYLVDHEKGILEQIAAYGDKIINENTIVNKLVLPIGTGIVGSVVESAKSELIKDTSKDHRYVLDNEARFSEITIPIISNGKVIGIIDSEHKDKNHYTNEHLKTLESIASLVAIKIRTALSIRERKKAEAHNIQLLSELEKSNDELHEYAHIVSHDLKSPLRSINALASWIKSDNEGKLDEITLQNFDLIDTTLETMEQLISNILEYSSADAIIDKDKDVDLNLTVDSIKKTLFIPENISVNVLSVLPTVKGDCTKFQQVFQNLISNAIKFSNKEKALIEIDFIEKSSFYQFSVKDNGIGIDKKFHDKIFKIFHSLQKSIESTGIGLSIVKKIIGLYGGDIWLESEPNIGSTFYFTIKRTYNENRTT